MTAACPFCAFDQPDVTVYRGIQVQAFISQAPINEHHVLVVPFHHYTGFGELPSPVRDEVFAVAQQVNRALVASVRPHGITMVTDDDLGGMGLNLVAHWKLHLIPRYRGDAVRIDWGRGTDPGEPVRAGYARDLREALAL